MGIEVTDEAAELLLRSLQLAGIDPATGGVRLRPARALGGGTDVQVELADGPAADENVIEAGGVRLFVMAGLTEAVPDPVVAVEPMHDQVVVRPGG